MSEATLSLRKALWHRFLEQGRGREARLFTAVKTPYLLDGKIDFEVPYALTRGLPLSVIGL